MAQMSPPVGPPMVGAMGRVFKDPYGQVNSVDFFRGTHASTHYDILVAGHDRGFVTVYSTFEGKKLTELDCSKYGVPHVTATHHAKSILHASTKEVSNEAIENNAVRYLSHHDNRYLRFFAGHKGRVTSVSMSPKSDQFLTTATDKQLLIWDLRVAEPQARMNIPGQPYASMDEEGLVFAASCNGGIVNLFDARKYEHGPFLSFPLPIDRLGVDALLPVSCLKFSANQKHLLAVIGNVIFLMDAYDGNYIRCWTNGTKEGSIPLEASFSYDGRFILSGSGTGHMTVFQCPHDNTLTPEDMVHLDKPVQIWEPPHPGIPACAKWSPNRKLAVSACHALVMWIPEGS